MPKEDGDLQLPWGTWFSWGTSLTKLPKEGGDLEARTKLHGNHPHFPSNLVRACKFSKSPSPWGPWFPIPLGRLHNGRMLLFFFTTCNIYYTMLFWLLIHCVIFHSILSNIFQTFCLLCNFHSYYARFSSVFHCEKLHNMDEKLHNEWEVEKMLYNINYKL